jgi:hypothetical protein
MELTGKAEEDFNQWLWVKAQGNEDWFATGLRFNLLCDSAKYGVLVDFFDSVGMSIDITPWSNTDGFEFTVRIYEKKYKSTLIDDAWSTRPEARTKAIEKANEIHNNRN